MFLEHVYLSWYVTTTWESKVNASQPDDLPNKVTVKGQGLEYTNWYLFSSISMY